MRPQNEWRLISDAVKIGSYEELDGVELSTLTGNKNDKEVLNGIIIRGYETKFANGTNENLQQYAKTALDNFIERYFVANKLNIPVTLVHGYGIAELVGRVLIVETNTVGFYFVAYLPKEVLGNDYDKVRALLKEGILQGFSKEGWATEWNEHYDPETGRWLYDEITEFELTCMSIVSTPANSVPFEKVQEIKNGLTFRKMNNDPKPTTVEDEIF